MYERSAIVLERYFENLLGYREEFNLRDNFNNYCELVTRLEKFQNNYQKELFATQEFNESIKKVRSIQAAQEKLYKKGAKLEYNRNMLFFFFFTKPEEVKRCIEKIEDDVYQNNEEMKELKDKLIEALVEYNDKRFELSKCKRYKKMAENDYDEVFETARINYEGIKPEDIEIAKKFAKFDDYGEIIEILEANGKKERIPFNEDVMRDATRFGVEIAKKEAASYLVMYDKMTKLLSDINNGTTKIELHKKYLRNEKAKVDFIYAVKEYLVMFLDYERMTIIHGRKSHNRLMSEACENFNTDIIQINNLYELLIKEIANKATKKAYKELYNKSYITDIKDKEERFKREKNRVNLNTATLVNSNYWRIEGIRGIYSVFYKNVSEVFGRDVAEFDIPKEFKHQRSDDSDQEENEEIYEEPIIEDTIRIPFDMGDDEDDEDEEDEDVEELEEDSLISEKRKKAIAAAASESFESDDESLNSYDDMLDNVIQEIKEGTDEPEFDIFGEKYQEIDVTEVIKKNEEELEIPKVENIEKIAEDMDNINIEPEEKLFEEYIEDEEDAEDLFSDVKKIKNTRQSVNEIENFDIPNEGKKKSGVLGKLRKINGAKKAKADSDVW